MDRSLNEFWRFKVTDKAEEMGLPSHEEEGVQPYPSLAARELISLMGTDQSVSFYEDYVLEYGEVAACGADEFAALSLDILSQWDDGPPCPRCGKSGRLEVVRSIREYRTFRGIGPDGDLLYDEEIINEQYQTVAHLFCGHCNSDINQEEVSNG